MGNLKDQVHTCFHCGNTGLMNYVGNTYWTYDEVERNALGDVIYAVQIEHEYWHVFECLVCHKPVLISEYCFDAQESRPEIKTEYPTIAVSRDGVPKDIYSAFESAVKTKGIDYSICLLSLRRVLEMICKDKGAEGRDLEKKIDNLIEKKIFPPMIERMTVEQILDWMCMFSRIFKSSIQTCICEYTLDEEYALDHLAEEEPFEPFRRLVENLKMCDRVGVETAFNGLSAERKNFQENRKLDNEIILENKVTIAEFLALTPAYGVVVGYITVPYILAAVGDFAGSMSAVQEAAQNT